MTLRLVINTDVDKKTMKKYLEGSFVDNVILLFCSEDPREREYLKTILHRIYGRFMPLRALIRSSIAHCCYNAIYQAKGDSASTNGIAEFVEIFCSIKAEHKDFLRNVLVPLHKCRKLDKFHEQLVACCVQFVFKTTRDHLEYFCLEDDHVEDAVFEQLERVEDSHADVRRRGLRGGHQHVVRRQLRRQWLATLAFKQYYKHCNESSPANMGGKPKDVMLEVLDDTSNTLSIWRAHSSSWCGRREWYSVCACACSVSAIEGQLRRPACHLARSVNPIFNEHSLCFLFYVLEWTLSAD